MGDGPKAPPLGRKVIEEAACARDKFEGSVAEVSVAVDAVASRADDCPFTFFFSQCDIFIVCAKRENPLYKRGK